MKKRLIPVLITVAAALIVLCLVLLLRPADGIPGVRVEFVPDTPVVFQMALLARYSDAAVISGGAINAVTLAFPERTEKEVRALASEIRTDAQVQSADYISVTEAELAQTMH